MRAVKPSNDPKPVSGWISAYVDETADTEALKCRCPTCGHYLIVADPGPSEVECAECGQRIAL